MTETRQRRVGAYAKLLANYASDDAIIAAGEKAELLFVRAMAFLATSDSDGYMTEAQVARFVGAGMRDALSRARKLVDVGLWEQVGGGYVVRSWTKIHETAEEKGRKLKADRDRKRLPLDSERSPNGIPEQGAPESLLGTYLSTYQPTEQSRAEHDKTEQGRAATPPPNGAGPPSMFCSKHPEGSEEPCGACATTRTRYAQHVQDTAGREADAKRARSAAIADCPRCDEHGKLLDPDTSKPVGRCDHATLDRATGTP